MTFSIPIVRTRPRRSARRAESDADANMKILASMEAGAGEYGFNPGESFTVMSDDLFTVTEAVTPTSYIGIGRRSW